MDSLETVVRTLASAAAESCGVEVVEVALRRAARRTHIRLDIDRAGPRGVDVDDCQRVSRAFEAAMEDRDPIPGSYVVEVSSPGIDRPIRSADDVRRNTGREIDVETSVPFQGLHKFRGILIGTEGSSLLLQPMDGGAPVQIPWDSVALAKQALPF